MDRKEENGPLDDRDIQSNVRYVDMLNNASSIRKFRLQTKPKECAMPSRIYSELDFCIMLFFVILVSWIEIHNYEKTNAFIRAHCN